MRQTFAVDLFAPVSASLIHKPIRQFITCTPSVSREEVVYSGKELPNFANELSSSLAFTDSFRWLLLLELPYHVNYQLRVPLDLETFEIDPMRNFKAFFRECSSASLFEASP